MDALSKDALFKIAIDLSPSDLLSFCAASTKIDSLICRRNDIWNHKLEKDFPNLNNNANNWKNLNIAMSSKSVKDKYILLYNLTVLKEKLKLKEDIEQLYSKTVLDLRSNRIKELPKEIGNLTNLQILYLGYNQIKELPKEIGNLTNLQFLYLGHNEIKEVPKEIGNLTNLQYLYLDNNQIKELPKEIGNLK